MNKEQKNRREQLIKDIAKIKYYSIEQFDADAKRYIKAIKERRMICIIHSVSTSGMTRNLSFFAQEKSHYNNEFNTLNFNQLFRVLGYREAKREGFIINGCGMDMVFHTNYTNIHDLFRLGYITKKVCSVLAQKTPVCL